MEAPQHNPVAPALQTLRQRVIQLVELRDVLQQSNEARSNDLQAAVADLKQLGAKHNQQAQECIRVAEENTKLRSNLKHLNDQVEALKQELETCADQLRQHPDLEQGINEGGGILSAIQHLLAERQQLMDICQALSKERNGLTKTLENVEKQLSRTKEALHHIFPREAYRDRRPDLATISDDGLAEHFTFHGINEGVELHYDILRDALLSEPNEVNRNLSAKLSELEALVSDYSKRLSFMNDLFIRLSLEGHAK
ncbi:MAG: hypothetical protein VKP70_04975 [Cyanobacteriota bacterium]|nr:hypothetical protein [Cyanobacteriota bacterium]